MLLNRRALFVAVLPLLALLTFTLFPKRASAGMIITVASATSLSSVLKEAGKKFTEVTGTDVRFSFASTGVLASQIRHGAPFDLFIAADRKYTDRLAKEGFLLPGSVNLLARGVLVVVVNRASGVEVKSIEELGSAGTRIAIGNPSHVPYGTAAKAALQSAGVWEEVVKKLVYAENVRQALQFVQSANAGAGIVAKSITLKLGSGFYTVEVPQELYPAVEHAAGVVADSAKRQEAALFIDFLKRDVEDIFTVNGLTLPTR